MRRLFRRDAETSTRDACATLLLCGCGLMTIEFVVCLHTLSTLHRFNALTSSRGQGGTQMPDLVIDISRVRDRVSDFIAQ